MSTFIMVNDRTPSTSISNAMTATESGRRNANRTSHIIAAISLTDRLAYFENSEFQAINAASYLPQLMLRSAP
jgi:hypothetical protein